MKVFKIDLVTESTLTDALSNMADVDVVPLCRRGNWARIAALRGGCARVQMASRQATAAGLRGTAGGSEHRGTVDKLLVDAPIDQ